MSSIERIDKYLGDAEKLVRLSNESKVIAELAKLKTWLQKHQYEVVPDGAKSKLLQVLTVYYKYNQQLITERKEVVGEKLIELFSDYLQLPEGKLLSSKDKRKVLQWQTNFSLGIPPSEPIPESEIFVVQDVNEDERLVTVQSTLDQIKWLENIIVDSEEIWISLLESFQAGKEVSVLVVERESDGKVLSLHNIK